MAVLKLMNEANEIKKNSAHTVRITSNENTKKFPLTLEGLLQNGINIAYKPEYQQLSDMVPLGSSIKSISDAVSNATGSNVLDGIAAQRYYTGASNININAVIKVTDEYGTGEPIRVAKELAVFCQPTDDLDVAATELANGEFTKTVSALSNVASPLVEAASSDGFVKMADSLGRTVNMQVSDFLNFPQMIIESVTQDFSYEQGIAGPVTAIFTLLLSTLRVPDTADVASMYKIPDGTQKSKRINYVGS